MIECAQSTPELATVGYAFIDSVCLCAVDDNRTILDYSPFNPFIHSFIHSFIYFVNKDAIEILNNLLSVNDTSVETW